MSSATIKKQPREVSINSPLPGKIKFFKADKLFGFVETSEGDLFFGTRGYRRMRGLGDGRVVLDSGNCPVEALETNLTVLVLNVVHTTKGGQAVEWTIPSLNCEEAVLWVVIQRIERRSEREVTSDPVCDNERRMFKTHTTRRVDTFINERIAYTTARKPDAEQYMEDHSVPYRQTGALGIHDRSEIGTKVSFRVESVVLA